jgi:galactitol-specific phosphotransferase system IIC component
MNAEDERLRKIEARLEKVDESLGVLRLVMVVLVVVVAGLLFAMQEIRRDIPQAVMIAVGVVATFIVITLVASKRGPQTKTWETKGDDPQ